MNFNEKLQQLRKQKGITQEELASHLFVSRTAISKWESGRGYPNLDSLKAIAAFFRVTVDELISADEVLTLAKDDCKERERRLCDTLSGLLDICMAMLIFLPFFTVRGATPISCSLLDIKSFRAYLVAAYYTVSVLISAVGVLTLAMQGVRALGRTRVYLSLGLSTAALLLFIVSSQPYAAVFTLVLLAVKALLLIKRP